MTLTPCSHLGVQYVLMQPRILQTPSPSTDWPIYSVHFKAIKNLTTPTSMYWPIHKWIAKQRCYCIWWCKEVFCRYGTEPASALFYDKCLLKVWFGLDNAILLLQKANACITVSETDSTMLLFLFFFLPEYGFTNSPATSTQFRHLKKTTIPPSCPRPHWVSTVHKQGWVL